MWAACCDGERAELAVGPEDSRIVGDRADEPARGKGFVNREPHGLALVCAHADENTLMKRTVRLGFAYLPGSIKARVGSDELDVEELDPHEGAISLDIPTSSEGRVFIDFERTLYRSTQPRPDQTIATSDACIYCGSQEDLSREHVIPYGLEGEFVIGRASCPACSDTTQEFERIVLRDALQHPRLALGIRSRHRRPPPTTLPLLTGDANDGKTIEVALRDHPTFIMLPRFLPPATLRGASTPDLEVTTPWFTLVGGSTLQEAALRAGLTKAGVRLEVDVYAFARLLAKIAHGFVAAADLGPIETSLPNSILEAGESVGWWVGGAPDETIGTEGLHGVRILVVDGIVNVRIRLFAQLGGPEYLVIAGRQIIPDPGREPNATIEPRPSSVAWSGPP
jgi:hypothetical protein